MWLVRLWINSDQNHKKDCFFNFYIVGVSGEGRTDDSETVHEKKKSKLVVGFLVEFSNHQFNIKIEIKVIYIVIFDIYEINMENKRK